MCREYCAYNLPAITAFIHNEIPQELNLWEATFRDLAGDPCFLVRKAVASCIQEITRILGKHYILFKVKRHYFPNFFYLKLFSIILNNIYFKIIKPK